MQPILETIGKKFLSSQIQGYTPIDPYREIIIVKGRKKSVRRALPKGLSKQDEKILASVRRRAHWLDKGFNICGMKFGWGFIFGLIPVLGDIFNFYLSYNLIILKSNQIDGKLPSQLLTRFYFNNLVSMAVGFVPLLGDVVAATWKSNSRNSALLEEYLISRLEGHSEAVAVESALGAEVDVGAEVDLDDLSGKGGSGTAKTVKTGASRKWYGWGKDD